MFSELKNRLFCEDKETRDNYWIFVSMLIGAVFSLSAALILSIEAVQLAHNPDAQLICSINSIVDCAKVSKSSFASVFGFPNSFLGLIAEPVVITVAIAGLTGVRFPRGFMFTAQIFYTLGLVFAYYLFFAGIFVIGAICPWCLIVTLATTFVFFAMTRYNIREGNLFLSPRGDRLARQFTANNYDKVLLFSVVALDFAALIIRYGGWL